VAPSGTNTLVGAIVSLPVSALVSVIVTPPKGAGVPRLIGNAAVWPSDTVGLEGTLIAPGAEMVMLAVAPRMFGAPGVAEMVAVPEETPVTSTLMLVKFAGIVTDGGTVRIAGLLELRPMGTPPAGAGAERLSVMF